MLFNPSLVSKKKSKVSYIKLGVLGLCVYLFALTPNNKISFDEVSCMKYRIRNAIL